MTLECYYLWFAVMMEVVSGIEKQANAGDKSFKIGANTEFLAS